MVAGARRGGPLLALLTLCIVGLVFRLLLVGQSLLADELATFWDVSGRSFTDMLSTVHSDAEISPPLTFSLGWLGLEARPDPAMLRWASLVAGVATIPIVYGIGRRVSSQAVGLTAAGLTTFAPFMVFYSTEARGYAVAMCLVAASTLALLNAAEGGRKRWWLAYAIAVAASAYTHYTTVFVLAFQLIWVLWAHPRARRAAIVATGLATLTYVPWLTGLHADLISPTTQILSSLQPFTPEAIRSSLVHWSFAYPYAVVVPVRIVPGVPATIALAIAVSVAALAALIRGTRGEGLASVARRREVVLVVGLGLSVPVGAAVVTAVTTNLFSTRNLAASWPGLAVATALLLVSAGPRLRIATAGLAVAALALGAVHMLGDDLSRPQYDQVAFYINEHSRPGDVIIDETAIVSPGPLSTIDPYLHRRGPIFRSLQPQQSSHPFTVDDRRVPADEAARKAVAAAHGRRIFLATDDFRVHLPRPLGLYRAVATRTWPGIFGTAVRVYALPTSSPG